MTNNNTVYISAGGTGGHIFPALSLAERMQKLGWQVHFVTDSRGYEFLKLLPENICIEEIRLRQLKKYNFFSWVRFFLDTLILILVWFFKFLRIKPNVVVGFGGYTSFPICASAVLSKIPLVLHEQNSVIGRVNKIFMKKSNCIAFGFFPFLEEREVLKIEDDTFSDLAAVIRQMEKKKPILVYLGNPVRTEILSRRNSIYTPPGDWPLAIFVVGGSQSADVFGEIVPKSLYNLPRSLRDRLRVYFQARSDLRETIETDLLKAGVRYEVSEFFEDICDKIANSQLVISRAGASTLSEIAVIGRPSILVPYPSAKDDHQSSNAFAMQNAGASIVVSQENFSPETMSRILEEFFCNPARAQKMADSAINFSKPKASENFGLLLNQMYRNE